MISRAAFLAVSFVLMAACQKEEVPSAELIVINGSSDGATTINGHAITNEELKTLMARVQRGEPLPERYSRNKKSGS